MGMRDLWLIGDDGSGAAKAVPDAAPRVCTVVGVRKVALGELVSARVCVWSFLTHFSDFAPRKIVSSDESKPDEHCFLIWT